MSALLETAGLYAGYDGQPVVRDVALEVPERSLVLLMGRNGAGKTTLVSAISGMIRPLAGTVTFAGVRMERMPAFRRTRLGIAHVPQDRGLLPSLTVAENLQLAERDGADRTARREQVYELFPRLRGRLGQTAGSLSGGEQQMLGLARAFLQQPRLLILDEPSMGLSPRIAGEVFDRIAEGLRTLDMAVLLVEQQISWVQELGIAERVYVLDQGEVVAAGGPELLHGDGVRGVYLGE